MSGRKAENENALPKRIPQIPAERCIDYDLKYL